MKRTLSGLLVGLLGLVITCGSAWAQATAQVGGAVQDQSGAVLPGVEITATQTSSGISRMTVSNEAGYYVLPNLPLGPYRLEASLPGFRTFVQTGIVLEVNSNLTINIPLQVGQVTETVEVQANAALVETRSASVGQVMEAARIVELPLNGRNAQELLLLAGGVVQAAPASGDTFPGRLLIASAGSLAIATEYALDGISHVDPIDDLPMTLPFPDALAEFKTEIGGMTAQQARGTQVSAVTKSGTNEFHGDLFEFVRNDLFNARSYFATKGSTLKRNQFGGTVGGPIVKNKLFFFAGYQGTTLRQDPADVREFVPTAAMLAGDFTAFTSAACNTRGQITLRAPFVNNRIDPALFSPVAVKVAARLPKTDNPCGEVTYGQKTTDDQKQLVSKIDYQSSAKHSLFGRFMYLYDNTPSPYKFTPVAMNTGEEGQISKAYMFTAGSTYLLSPTTVNAFRLAFNRGRNDREPIRNFDLTELGSKVYSGGAPKTAAINVTSGFSLGGRVQINASNLYQIADDVSMTRGTHQFGFGVRLAEARTITISAGNVTPNFTITGDATGAGLADFLLGRVNEFTQGQSGDTFSKAKQVSFYGQDSWQLTPRLNVSYGLRWSPILPQQDLHRPVPFILGWDIERYRQGLRSTVFVNAPPGILFAGDPGFVQNNNGANAAKPKADAWNPYWKAFSPRLGLAWDVEGNGRTSIRASYGLNYVDYPAITRQGSQVGQPPYGSLTRVIAPRGGLDDPWRDFPGGNPFPLQITKDMPFIPLGEYYIPKPELTPTYIQTWNLSVQREVAPGTLLSLSYVGTQTMHTQVADPINAPFFVPGVGDANGNCFLNGQVTHYRVAPGSACSTINNTQARRALSFLNPAFVNEIGRFATTTDGGTQNYNGMIVAVQRRASQSLTINGNYTWSHCVGDYSARINSGRAANVHFTYQDPNDRRRDRGNCEIDQRNTFNLTAVAETPQFANRTLRLVGGGWRLSGIYRASTGGVVVRANQSHGLRTVTLAAVPTATRSGSGIGGDRCLCDISGQRPNLLLPDAVYLDTSGRPNTQWVNPAAFGQPALGTLGNMGRANMRVPTAWQFDMALARLFRFRETQSLEFRAEAYNVLNSFRPGDINMNLSSAQFGKIRTALDPRILQFALKYLF